MTDTPTVYEESIDDDYHPSRPGSPSHASGGAYYPPADDPAGTTEGYGFTQHPNMASTNINDAFQQPYHNNHHQPPIVPPNSAATNTGFPPPPPVGGHRRSLDDDDDYRGHGHGPDPRLGPHGADDVSSDTLSRNNDAAAAATDDYVDKGRRKPEGA